VRKKNKNKNEFEFGFPKSKPESFRFGNTFNFVENKNQVRKKNKNEFEFGFPKSKAEPKPKMNPNSKFSQFQSVFAFTIILFLVASLASVIHRTRNKNFGSSGDYNSSSELSEPQVQIAGEEIVPYDYGGENQSLKQSESESTEDGTEKILSDLGFEKMEIYEENEPVKTFWKNDDLIFIQGKILRIASDAVTSSKIDRHAIEAEDIDTNSVTSRTIRDNTIKGIDIDEDTSITIESLNTDNISAGTITADVINGIFINSGALSGITTINMSGQLTSTVANGTAPFVITSTTVSANLNADLLDGQHGSYYAAASSISGTDNYIPRFNGTSALENSVIYDDGTNVGIGTTSPETILHIAQEGTGPPVFERSGAAADVSYYSQYLLATKITNMNNGFGSGLGFQIRDNAGVRNTIASVSAVRNGADNSGDLIFATASTGTFTERMRITSGGNVGVGTTSPGGKLDLLATSGSQLRLSYSDSVYTDFTVESTGNISIAPNTVGATTTIGAGTDVAIKVDSVGNVGIGTTAPVSSLSIDGNVSIGNVAAGTDGIKVLVISNGNAPSTSPSDSIQLYSEDVTASSELKVRDEAGNITTLSPHNFSLIPEGRSENLAWSYYSQRGNEAINVDMTKAIRLVEQLTGEKLIYLKDLKSGGYKDAQSEIDTPLALELLENQKFSIDENADTIETLKKSINEKLSGIELKMTKNESDIDGQIRDIVSLQEKLQNQVDEMVRQNSVEGIGLVEARLGSMEMALNVNGSDVDILGSLSVLGNVNVLEGKIVAKDIEALGIIKAEEIQTKIFGITSEKVSDKAEIEAGSTEKIIETPYASEDSKIYITIEGSNYGKVLYYDEVIEGESFKVKFDGDAVEEKIKFNWMIMK
jgi:hypothetical protein